MMRVAMELTALQLDRAGTARAIEQLLPKLEADPRVEIVPLSHRGRVAKTAAGTILRGLARELWYLPHALPRAVERANVDLLHCPSQLAPPRSSVPMVVTLHDAIGWDHPEWLTRANVLQLQKRLPLAIKAGAHVITSSQYSRERIAERLSIDPSRITVVAPGIDARFTPGVTAEDSELLARLGVSERFVLTVGTLQPRKNVEAAISAFERIATGHRDWQLVVAGARGWHDDELQQRLRESAASDRILALGRVTDQQLIALYRAADCFVFPSRYEGFGFPPLEAMACGTPVISSARTSLDEIIGDAAIAIDPDDPEQIAAHLAEVLDTPGLADRLRSRGIEHAAAFTWEASASRTVDVYAAAVAAAA
jgi:glycosyltransferase involved in cell wall biosynthesis